MFSRLIRVFVFAIAALGLGMGYAQQGEPSIKQVYEAAQAGRVDQAQRMMDEVLQRHPTSAKAYYVRAELDARQGRLAEGRTALAKAEQLEPGLPFAKAEAVTALRGQLDGSNAAATSGSRDRAGAGSMGLTLPAAAAVAPAASGGGFHWGYALLLVAFVGFIWTMVRRRREAAAAASYGYGAYGAQPAPMGPGAPAGYPGGPVAQPGMGSNLMGGLATGLAVGAGVVAAEQIGRHLLGGDHGTAQPGAGQNFNNNDGGFTPIDPNPGMGGDNFGIQDNGSWDDGGSFSDGGGDGGGWDN